MKKTFFLLSVVILFSITAFSQDGFKIVDYKLIKFEKKVKGEYLVPQGEYWRIESIVTHGEDKIEFEINDELYILLYKHHIGVSDDFLPFTIPGETKFSMKPIEGNFVINIAVLKKK